MLDFRGQILSVWHFWLMMTKYASQVYGGYKTLTQCHMGPSSWMTLSYYSGFLWGLRPSTYLFHAGKKLQDGFFDCPDYLTLGLIGSLLVQMFNVQNSFYKWHLTGRLMKKEAIGMVMGRGWRGEAVERIIINFCWFKGPTGAILDCCCLTERGETSP